MASAPRPFLRTTAAEFLRPDSRPVKRVQPKDWTKPEAYHERGRG